jgi:hypothetical protein
MLLRKAYRFRIYPDATQEELFRRTIGCCRLVYNLMVLSQTLADLPLAVSPIPVEAVAGLSWPPFFLLPAGSPARSAGQKSHLLIIRIIGRFQHDIPDSRNYNP